MTDRRCDVVIATRNRPDRLARCLEGLRAQSATDFGVVIVDDASAPPVADGVDGVSFAGLDVRLIAQPIPSGPAAARNAGVAAGRGDYVIFIDDDVVADRRLIDAHLTAVTAPHDPARPIVSCGPFVQPADWDPTPWNLWEARQAKKEADNLLQGVYEVGWRQFHTGNNCLPRPLFDAVGGFDESFTRAEDDEFALRVDEAGCVFHFEPQAIAWHYSNRTLEAWLEIPRAYARFDVEIDRLHPEWNFLATKKAERSRRRLPLRLARAALSGERRSRWGVRFSTATATLLYRLGFVDLSMGALSVAYDLSYTQSLRTAELAAH